MYLSNPSTTTAFLTSAIAQQTMQKLQTALQLDFADGISFAKMISNENEKGFKDNTNEILMKNDAEKFPDYWMGLPSFSFSEIVNRRLSDGESFADAVKNTKGELFKKYFKEQLALNNGDVKDAIEVAKKSIGAEISDEDLSEFITELFDEYTLVNNSHIANQLFDYLTTLNKKAKSDKALEDSYSSKNIENNYPKPKQEFIDIMLELDAA